MAVSVSELLPAERVFTGEEWRSKKRVFEQVSIAFENASAAARDKIFSALMERERLGSTYIDNGGAIPHGRMTGLKSPIAALVLLEKPIQYDGDDSAAQTLFFLLVPPGAEKSHLLLLGLFAEMISDVDLLAALHKAEDPAAAAALLAQWEADKADSAESP